MESFSKVWMKNDQDAWVCVIKKVWLNGDDTQDW